MNYEDIKKLIQDMGDSKIDSLDIEFPEGIKISMKKNQTSQVVTPVQTTQVTMATSNVQTCIPQEEVENCQTIKSPMVGTFYQSASPKEPAFVKVGDKVKKGDVLCIVEAMKLMNEIESDVDGEIIQICVQNEEMVEYGTPLFKIR